MPKIEFPAWTEGAGEPNKLFGHGNGPYAEVSLGDAVGLEQFGVRIERLPPGSRSSYRHWHETEDEFVYVLSGELVLVEEVECILKTGEAAGWRAGQPIAHCLENRSSSHATVLIVGMRSKVGVVHYPDDDIIMYHDETGQRFTRTDGSLVTPKN